MVLKGLSSAAFKRWHHHPSLRRFSSLRGVKPRQNEHWMQDDVSTLHYGCFDTPSMHLAAHDHGNTSAHPCQQHNASDRLWPQQDHDHTLAYLWQQHQQHDQHETSIGVRQQHDHGDRLILLQHHRDHHSTSVQLCQQNSCAATSVGLWQQNDCTTTRLWQEKELVFSSFFCRYHRGSSDGHGDKAWAEDIKLELLLFLCRKGHLDRALDVLFCLGTAPPTLVYLSILNECSKSKAFAQANRVYAYIGQHMANFTDLLAEYLVLTISNDHAISDVHQTPLSLPCLSAFAWSAMISALVEDGHAQEALQMVQQMHEDGTEPSSYTFVSLIKACGITEKLWHGKKLHAAACMKGIASHLIVGSTLVSMYGKCSAIREAENVFSAICPHDVVSCNAMLAAYVGLGQGDNALRLYRQMHAEGMHANQGTFVIAIQACRCLAEVEEVQPIQERGIKTMSLEIGHTLHADIRREGFALDAFINNTLVNMYGKIGAIMEAEFVFDTMSYRDVISWNAMLAAYVENNEGQKALWLYRMMLQEHVNGDALTCVFALQACDIVAEDEQAVIIEGRPIKVGSLKIGQVLHLDACTLGLTSDLFLCTALLSMYGMCGAVLEAEDVFLRLPERDIVSWNAMLSAYVEQDRGDKALQLFRQMQECGVGANSQTLVFALQASVNLAEVEEARTCKGRLVKAMALEIGQAVHGYAFKKGFTSSFVCNTLVSMYGHCGTLVEAEHVFAALSQPEVVSWNVMLSAYVEQGRGGQALQLYHQMQVEGISPNHLTFVFVLQACGVLAEGEAAPFVKGGQKRTVALEIGVALHKDALSKGLASDAFVGNTLLSMYGKCGDVLERNSVFLTLLHRDIVSWNAMLSMCIEEGEVVQALRLYKQLEGQRITSDDATLTCILQACSTTGSLEICEQVHFSIISAGYEQCPSVAATLMYAYGSCARVADMQASFNELLKADSVSWNACIAGHLGGGDVTCTARMYEEMKRSCIKPDEVTFTSVLSACSHFGLAVNGCKYLESMCRHYNITPNLKHYGAMIDLFGRAGDFRRVEILLKRMPWEPDLSISLCLLGACRTHGNLELAEWAFDHAVSLQPKQATAYILMSNIYAEGSH